MTAQPHQPKPIDIANTTFSGYIPTDEDLKSEIRKALDKIETAGGPHEHLQVPPG